MKIERLRFLGFGKLRNCEIVFDPEKANLLIEENEFGKSTIVAAIVAALYGFPPRDRTTSEVLSEKETYRPEDGGPYQVSLDVRALGRRGWTRLRIFRDFARGRMRVFNLDEGGREITEDFAQRQKEIGEILLGLSRDQFLNTCLVRQAALHALPNLGGLAKQLQRIADAEAGDRTADEAIEALKQALREFPASRMGKGLLQIETEIKRTEDELREIMEELKRLERERHQVEPKLDRICQIEREIEDARRQQRLAHYLRERAEYEQLERWRQRREELEAERCRLQQDAKALAPYETFPAARLVNLERWMGALRQIAHERAKIEEELKRAHRQCAEMRQKEEQFGPLASFTQEERRQLDVLAEQYKELQQRIHQDQQKVQAEQQRLAERGMSLEELEHWRKHVGALELEERRQVLDAHARWRDLERQSQLFKERQQEHLALCAEIERERDRKHRWAGSVFPPMLVGVVATSLALLFGFDRVGMLFGLPTSLLLALWLFLRHAARTHRRHEWTRAQSEADRLDQEIERLQAERARLEEQVRPLLAQTGLDSLEALARACARLETLTAELQPLLRGQAALGEHERELQQKRDLLRTFLERSGRPSAEPTLAEIERLNRDLDCLFELRRDRMSLEEQITRTEAKLENTRQKEQEYRESLLALLREASVIDPAEANPSLEDLEAASERFREGVAQHDRLQRVKRELEHVERNLKELPELAELHERRERINQSLRRREAEDSALASQLPERSAEEYATEAERWNDRERELRKDLQQLQKEIAIVLDRLEKQRPELLERQEELTRHLKRVQNFKRAAEYALDVFRQIAGEIRGQWANALTGISQELLRTLNTDYVALHFDPGTLEPRVQLKTSTSIVQTNQLRSQLSLGTREQLSLIARLAVSRYLSRQRQLPFIFDEPFANSDDERFARLMRLLLDDLSREHQVIITSCHQQRHQWLKARHPDLFAERVHWCELSPLEAP